jgi:hypothetical protein
MPALHTEFYTSVFSSATALFDDTSVRDAFRSNLHNSNIVYAHALKRLAKEKSGEALADDEFWIACGTNSPQRTVHFVLSCTEGPMGTYPIFIFSPLPLAHISAPFLSSHMERLVQVLYKVLGQQPQRVYSVFSPKPVAHEFKRLWSETTAVASYLEPYYAAKLSFCTRKSFVNRQLTGHPDLIHNPRPAVEADIPKVAPLCYGFAQESVRFVIIANSLSDTCCRSLLSCQRQMPRQKHNSSFGTASCGYTKSSFPMGSQT